MSEASGAATAEPTPRKSKVPLPGWLPPALLACAAGMVHALSFAPANLPWLEILALAFVFRRALQAACAGDAAIAGFAFGLGWLGLGLSWIYISLHKYGGLPAALAIAAVASLAAILALLPAFALALASRCGGACAPRRALAIVCAWTIAEWFRGILLGGLPWLSTGYAHADGPLAGYAPVLGVYGVGAAAAAVAAVLAWMSLHARAQRSAALAAVGATFTVCACGWLLHRVEWTRNFGTPIRVRLVQGNIPQDVKFAEGGLDQALTRYLPTIDFAQAPQEPQSNSTAPPRSSPPAHPDLIVLPESAFPVALRDLPEEALDIIGDPHKRAGAALVFGAFLVEPHERYFNSAIGLDGQGGEAQRYSKRHLVPFGEFIPFGFHWFVDLLDIPIGDQERGADYQTPMNLAGERIAVNICFEDLFGALIRTSWQDPERAPTMLLNLSNLAWFDDSSALAQHLQISRMRALETGRPLLRATNTGITAIIAADGSVQAQLPIQTLGVLEGAAQGKTGSTPFIRAGNLPILLLSAAALAACALRTRQRESLHL